MQISSEGINTSLNETDEEERGFSFKVGVRRHMVSPDPCRVLDFCEPPARASIQLGSKVRVQPATRHPSVGSSESKVLGFQLLPLV